jgi:hypothetical protein
MKRVGVRYCGGCNPRYDRRAAFERVRDDVLACAEKKGMELSIEHAEEGVTYDVLLVVSGCASRCATFAQFGSRAAPVHMWDADGIVDASERLCELIGEENDGLEKIL